MEARNPVDQLASSRRILVLGSSGSGKTTFSTKLARVLQLETIHLDAHFWMPGWIPTPASQWRERVCELVANQAWVMDGTYEDSLELRIPAADCIVMIERSRIGCLYRVLKRKLTIEDHCRVDAPSGQPLDLAFLRYIWQYPKVTAPIVLDRIDRFGPSTPVVRLRTFGETEQVIQDLRLRLDGDGRESLAAPPLEG